MAHALFHASLKHRNLLVGFLVAIACLTGTGAALAMPTGPPVGLTPFGRVVWNLDALLHDTFGNRRVWANPSGPDGQMSDFSTTFRSTATSAPYVYTFANARVSSFRAVRPTRPPRIGTYATGSNVPVKIRGAYISCAKGKWLYERQGQAFPNGPMWCSPTPLAP